MDYNSQPSEWFITETPQIGIMQFGKCGLHFPINHKNKIIAKVNTMMG